MSKLITVVFILAGVFLVANITKNKDLHITTFYPISFFISNVLFGSSSGTPA